MIFFVKGLVAMTALAVSGVAWLVEYVAPKMMLANEPDQIDRAMALFMRFMGLAVTAFAVLLWYLVFAI